MAVKRNERGVIFIRVRRALLEIERENREPFFAGILRGLPAGKTQQLEELPAIFLAVGFVGEHRIKKIVLARFNGRDRCRGKKTAGTPRFFPNLFAGRKKTARWLRCAGRNPASAEIDRKAARHEIRLPQNRSEENPSMPKSRSNIRGSTKIFRNRSETFVAREFDFKNRFNLHYRYCQTV